VIAESFAGSTPQVRPRKQKFQRSVASRARSNRLVITGLVLADIVALVLAISATAGLRLVLDEFLPVVALGYPERHVFASLFVLPVLLVLFRLHGLYDTDSILVGSQEYARIGNAVTYGVLIVLVSSFFIGDGPLVSRSWLLLLWLTSVSTTGLGRFTARRVVRRLRHRGLLRTRVVVVGASAFGVAIAEQLRAARNEGLDVIGFLDEFIPIGQPLLGDIEVIGRPSDLVRGSVGRVVDEYLLVPQALPHERLAEITRLMVACDAPTVRMAVSSSDLLTHGLRIAERASVPLVTIKRARITGIDAILKRGLDLVGAAAALFALGPMAMVILLRGRHAPGCRALVEQSVRGACGEPISFSLFPDETVHSPLLRGVPALLAVLAGRLSLVGPRPTCINATLPEIAELGLTAAKPGLTGPWRLGGPGSSLADQAVRDLAYVRDYTIWEDLRIISRSLWLVLRDRTRNQLERWQDTAGDGLPMGSGT